MGSTCRVFLLVNHERLWEKKLVEIQNSRDVFPYSSKRLLEHTKFSLMRKLVSYTTVEEKMLLKKEVLVVVDQVRE